MVIPRLYAIVDASYFLTAEDQDFFVRELLGAGVTLLQYRDKSNSSREVLDRARRMQTVVGGRARLIMNDRPDLCLIAAWDGVHLGQDDISPIEARRIIGPERWLGISTHNPEQVVEADKQSATYVAIGPVFSTRSKVNPDPVIGLEGVQKARSLTSKPLVAIGGINRSNVRSVMDAGADAVAIISDLNQGPRKSAETFLELLR
jgi:thiamine-phosphate pyrophosphorylase